MTINRRCAFGVALLASVSFATGSVAQENTLKEKVVGTWILASITSSKDGADIPQPDLQGVLTYTADGYFHFVSMRKDLPKIAANDRTKPTPEEAMRWPRARWPIPAATQWMRRLRPSTRPS